jgi:hypothetical protein
MKQNLLVIFISSLLSTGEIIMFYQLMKSNLKLFAAISLFVLFSGLTGCNNQKSDRQMITTISREKTKYSSSKSDRYSPQSNETECYKMRVYFSLFEENAKILEESALDFDRLEASDNSGFHFNRIWARTQRQLAEIERAKARKIQLQIAAKCGQG